MSSTTAGERRFPSRYSVDGADVTPLQWLAEWATAKQAAKEGVTLSRGFWRTSVRWNKIFSLQSRAASALLRLFPLEVVGAVLRGPQGRRVYSLAAPWLTDLCRDEQRRLELKRAAEAALEADRPAAPKVEDDVALPAGRRPTTAVGKRGSLEQLEGL